MKKLTKEAVCEIAEMLISKNGSTTTLDVKNHLRTRGYEAFQNEVSRFMQHLTNEENWQFRNNGRYKVYSFGQNTHNSLEEYLEKGDVFWKITLERKQIIIEEGKIGENGLVRTENSASNRKAYKKAVQKLNQKKQEGFNKATDKRLPFQIRNEFADFLSQKPQTISLSFFNAEEKRERKGVLQKDNKTQDSYEELTYNAGINFTFETKQVSKNDMYSMTQSNLYSISELSPHNIKVLGRNTKPVQKLAYDIESKTLSTEYHQYFQSTKEEFKIFWQVKPQCLYEVKIQFQNKQQLILNKHTQNLDTIIYPILLEILKD